MMKEKRKKKGSLVVVVFVRVAGMGWLLCNMGWRDVWRFLLSKRSACRLEMEGSRQVRHETRTLMQHPNHTTLGSREVSNIEVDGRKK